MYITCETWLVKEEYPTTLERNDARMVRCMGNVEPEDKTSAEKFRTRLKLNRMRKCLQDRRLQWFGHLARIEENAWSSKCRLVVVSPEDNLGKHGMR